MIFDKPFETHIFEPYPADFGKRFISLYNFIDSKVQKWLLKLTDLAKLSWTISQSSPPDIRYVYSVRFSGELHFEVSNS